MKVYFVFSTFKNIREAKKICKLLVKTNLLRALKQRDNDVRYEENRWQYKANH